MKIKYLTFECVSKCNMNCRFCFSYWRDNNPEISSDKAKEAIQILKNQGLEAINFTGGEPLLRKDIDELIKYAKQLGLITILTTNGILLKEKLGKIKKYIDFIALPLDSDNSNVHNNMRNTMAVKDHYKLIFELLDYLHKNYPKIGIKINTVVTKKNKNSIIGIGNLVKGKIVSWKLSHFIPGAYGKKYQKEFEISNEEFIKVSKECIEKNKGINIIASIAHSRDSGCRILSTEGHLLKPDKNSLIDLGDITNLISDKDFNENINVHFLNKTYPKIRK